MSCLRLAPLTAVLALVAASGCGTARIINANPDGGVVSIPSNNNSWPFNYRDKADKLMAQRCPNGYDVVREEEVVVGQKSTTTAQAVTPASYSDGKQPMATTVSTSTRAETEYRITFRSRSITPPVPATVLPPPIATRPAPPPEPLPGGLPSRPIPVTGS